MLANVGYQRDWESILKLGIKFYDRFVKFIVITDAARVAHP